MVGALHFFGWNDVFRLRSLLVLPHPGVLLLVHLGLCVQVFGCHVEDHILLLLFLLLLGCSRLSRFLRHQFLVQVEVHELGPDVIGDFILDLLLGLVDLLRDEVSVDDDLSVLKSHHFVALLLLS